MWVILGFPCLRKLEYSLPSDLSGRHYNKAGSTLHEPSRTLSSDIIWKLRWLLHPGNLMPLLFIGNGKVKGIVVAGLDDVQDDPGAMCPLASPIKFLNT